MCEGEGEGGSEGVGENDDDPRPPLSFNFVLEVNIWYPFSALSYSYMEVNNCFGHETSDIDNLAFTGIWS